MPVDVEQPGEPTPGDAPPGDVPGGVGTTDSGASTGTDSTFDPAAILASLFGQQKAPVDPEVRAADALYLKIWGVAPPKGYVEGLVKQGLNLYEIQANEMAKPAFASTRAYRDQWATLGGSIADLFGRR